MFKFCSENLCKKVSDATDDNDDVAPVQGALILDIILGSWIPSLSITQTRFPEKIKQMKFSYISSDL